MITIIGAYFAVATQLIAGQTQASRNFCSQPLTLCREAAPWAPPNGTPSVATITYGGTSPANVYLENNPNATFADNAARHVLSHDTITLNQLTPKPSEIVVDDSLVSKDLGRAAGHQYGDDYMQSAGDQPRQDAADTATTFGQNWGEASIPSDYVDDEELLTFTGGDPVAPPADLGGDNEALEQGENAGTDPVSVTTGEFVDSKRDIHVPGIGLDFELIRTYRSRANYDGPLGHGWDHTYNQYLVFGECDVDGACCQDKIVWMTGRGYPMVFHLRSGGWETEWNSGFTLVQGAGAHVINDREGVSYRFEGGKLVSITDRNSNAIQLAYQADALSTVTDTLGREFRFAYDTAGKLDSVTSLALNLQVNYQVNGLSELESAVSTDGVAESYEYSPPTSPDNSFLPTRQANEACSERCSTDVSACGAQSFCAAIADQQMTACKDGCSANEVECGIGCTRVCEGECAASQRCEEACTGQCAETCERAAWTICNTEVEEKVREDCGQTCARYVGNACTANCELATCIGFGFDSSLPVICDMAGMRTIIMAEWVAISAILETFGCLGDAFSEVLDWAFSGFSDPVEPKCGYNMVKSAVAEFCGNRCTNCLEWGVGCDPGSCHEGITCRDACVNTFLNGQMHSTACTSVGPLPEGCQPQTKKVCQDNCDEAYCHDACGTECPTECNAACADACSADMACVNSCVQGDFASACSASCFSSCQKDLSHPSGNPTFGVPQDLNHNLVKIRDAANRVVIEMSYGSDMFLPSFDRVVWQNFGGRTTSFHYLDHETGVDGIPASARSELSDTLRIAIEVSEIEEICPESITCHTAAGELAEDWLELGESEYVVFPRGQLECLEENCDALLGWPVTKGALPRGVPFVLLDASNETPFELSVSPPVQLGELQFQIPGGTVDAVGGSPGVLTLSQNALELVAGFGRDGSSGMRFTLMATTSGLRIRRGHPEYGVRIAPLNACNSAFQIVAKGASIDILPKSACSSDFRATEILRYRRAVMPSRPILTSPYGTVPVRLDEEIAVDGSLIRLSVRPDDVAYHGNQWEADQSPAAFSPPPSDCSNIDPLGLSVLFPLAGAVPGIGSCADRLGIDVGSLSRTEPTCEIPDSAWVGGGTALACWGALSYAFSDLPAEAAPIASLPPADPSLTTRCVVRKSLEERVIRNAVGMSVLVIDSDANSWVFGGSPSGELLRGVEGDTGSDWVRNFDADHRLAATRTQSGVRSCKYFDSSGNVVLAETFPSPTRWSPFSSIRKKYSYGPYGVLTTEYDPSGSRPYWSAEYDANGNLDQLTFADGAVFDVLETDRGRIKRARREDGSEIQFTFDPVTGQPDTTALDAAGPEPEITSIQLSPAGHPIHVQTPAGLIDSWTWRGDGRIANYRREVPGSGWFEQKHLYNPTGHLWRITQTSDQLDQQWSAEFDWDLRGNVTHLRRTDATGVSDSCFRHDGRGLLVESVDPEGVRTIVARNSAGQVTDITIGTTPISGSALAWEQPCTKRRSKSQLLQGIYSATYSVDGFMSSETSNGTTTSYSYDGFGRPLEQLFLDGSSIRFGFDQRNLLYWVAAYSAGTGAFGETSPFWTPRTDDVSLVSYLTYRHDHKGRLTTERAAWFDDTSGTRQWKGIVERKWKHNDILRTLVATDRNGHSTVLEHDALGRPRSIDVGGLGTIEIDHLNHGERVMLKLPANNPGQPKLTREIFRDALGNPRSIIENGVPVATFNHDALGNLRRSTSAVGSYGLGYTGTGLIASITRTLNGTEHSYQSRSYYSDGKIFTTTDGNGASRDFSYDELGRLASIAYQSGGVDAYAYHPGTTLVSQELRRDGSIVDYSYSALGKLSTLVASNVDNVQFWGPSHYEYSYSLLGMTSAEVDHLDAESVGLQNRSRLEFSRDSLGNVVMETSSLWRDAILTQRTAEGQARRLDWGTLSFERVVDALGRPKQVSATGVPTTYFHYAGLGGPHRIEFGSGVKEHRTYDAQNRFAGVRIEGSSGGGTLAQQDVYYSTEGVAARLDHTSVHRSATSVFVVDDLARVTDESAGVTGLPAMSSGQFASSSLLPFISNGTWQRRTFDLNDNIDSQTTTAGAQLPLYDTDGVLTEWDEPIGANGLGQTLGRGGTEFNFDATGGLSYAQGKTGSWFFRADALGRLAEFRAEASSVSTVVAYLDHAPIGEAAGTSDAFLLVPGADRTPLIARSLQSYSYLHAGWGDRLFATTDSSGSLLETIEYTAAGTPSFFDSNGLSAILSCCSKGYINTGARHFGDIGLYQFGARWYRPEWGRFLSPDPVGLLDGSNVYAFVGGQYLSYVDPLGLGREANEHSSLLILKNLGAGAYASFLEPYPYQLITNRRLQSSVGYEDWYEWGRVAGSLVGLGADIVGTAAGGTMVGGALAAAAASPLGGPAAVGGAAAIAPEAVLAGAGLAVLSVQSAKGHLDQLSEAVNKLSNPVSKAKHTIRERLRDAGLPGGSKATQVGPFRFRPPEGYQPGNPLPRGKNGGFLDRFKNEWIKGPYHGDPAKGFTFEWDVQLSTGGKLHYKQYGLGDKDYINVAPDGTLSH